MSEHGRLFILYDGRAKMGEPSEASIMDTADTEEEARKSGQEDWKDYDAIWYEYQDDNDPGEPRWDLPPAPDLE